jgi:glucitol operon activator protein
MHSALVILAAVVAGWAVQLYLSYQQSMAFNRQVLRLRSSGTVSVGAGGKRYRGGRAFVAIAVDDHGIVRDALSLSGFTTFARARPVPALFDLKLSAVRGDRDLPQLSRQQREAARQAALLFTQGQDALAGV